jgi:putative methyltransferase (TIGR04325 family)
MPFEKALSWEDAQTRSLGYTHERVTRVYKEKTSSQPANLSERIHERKTVFNTLVERSGLLQFKEPISVLDVGGGNGYFLDWVTELEVSVSDYWVLESSQIVNHYRNQYKHKPKLHFIDHFDTTKKYDLVILSCFLQYFKDNESAFKFAQAHGEIVFVLRHPISNHDEMIYTIQTIENHEGTSQTVSWPHVIFEQNWIYRNLLDSHILIHAQKMIAEEVLVESNIYPMECYLILSEKKQEKLGT